MNKRPSAIFIMGPTAAGKTDLAIRLVQNYPLEIISVDSAQVYRGMDIGTAKPSAAELSLAPHRLIDIRDPSDAYSSASFRRDALSAMKEIHAEGKIPLLVGGSMLYHRSLLYGLSELPAADAAVRSRLTALLYDKGKLYLHQQLEKIDPLAAQRIHPNDPQRVQRALEVYELTGKCLTELQNENKSQSLPWTSYKIIVAPASRSLLRERIALRFHQMIEFGFIEEVSRLYQRDDLDLSMPSMRAVGYRQVWEHLQGKMTKDEMIERGITASRQFAKRQMTWLKQEQNVLWIDTEQQEKFQQALKYLAPILN